MNIVKTILSVVIFVLSCILTLPYTDVALIAFLWILALVLSLLSVIDLGIEISCALDKKREKQEELERRIGKLEMLQQLIEERKKKK